MARGKHSKARKPKYTPPKDTEPTQILPYLFVGPRTTTEPSVAAAAGITHIISLGCRPKNDSNDNSTRSDSNAKENKGGGVDNGQRRQMSYHHIGLKDTPHSDLSTAALLVADIIANARHRPSRRRVESEAQGGEMEEEKEGDRDADAKVLVHCIAGVSRSPAVLAYYLMRDEDMSLRDALATIMRARPAIRPNDGFLRQLRELEAGLRGKETLKEVETLPLRTKERMDLLLGLEGEKTSKS
ncbi:uncharacterized protein PG998_009459 [Apiospora kogelbergensis]|uniref:protein-tyrosine-phosphatase n=1 Tax=Apiospora kogelbergensis TaxID=1337665 RepID=A0AAW0R7V9_9PEZI